MGCIQQTHRTAPPRGHTALDTEVRGQRPSEGRAIPGGRGQVAPPRPCPRVKVGPIDTFPGSSPGREPHVHLASSHFLLVPPSWAAEVWDVH